MSKRVKLAQALAGALALGMTGCHRADDGSRVAAPDRQGAAAVGKGATATQAPPLGPNPNYQGPVNGGLGSKVGGGR